MKLRELSDSEITNLASKPNVRRIAVENFLMSMGDDSLNAYLNLDLDTRLYKWNAPTQNAIRKGIALAQKPAK